MKYERAEAKVSAGGLYELAKILSADISDFFINLSAGLYEYSESNIEGRKIIELVADYRKIENELQRSARLTIKFFPRNQYNFCKTYS